jgi:hypothetical protein
LTVVKIKHLLSSAPEEGDRKGEETNAVSGKKTNVLPLATRLEFREAGGNFQ